MKIRDIEYQLRKSKERLSQQTTPYTTVRVLYGDPHARKWLWHSRDIVPFTSLKSKETAKTFSGSKMSSRLHHIKLAQSLPPRLLRFFARFPPAPFLFLNGSSITNGEPFQALTPNSAYSDTDTSTSESRSVSAESSLPYENPFRSTKHPVTNTWHDPVYSLRRQADLVKLAREYGVERLLPFTTKGTEERIRKRTEHGLRVKGTGEGQRVRGKWQERTMKSRLERRRQAMLEMPKLIQTWKQVRLTNISKFTKLTVKPAWPRSWMEEIP